MLIESVINVNGHRIEVHEETELDDVFGRYMNFRLADLGDTEDPRKPASKEQNDALMEAWRRQVSVPGWNGKSEEETVLFINQTRGWGVLWAKQVQDNAAD